MKRINLFAASAICLAASVSCQEELTENIRPEEKGDIISKTLYAEGNDWIADTKTVYDPGTGIVWTGTEPMDIFYGENGWVENESTGAYMRHVTGTVTNNGNGTYSFSHETISGVDSYDYSVITPVLPSTRGGKTNSDGTSIVLNFSPIQTPGQNTHDPNYDLLYGKGVKGVSAAEELTIDQFKRISTPLKLELVDNGNALSEGEKIRAVTASFDQSTTNHNALAGVFYMSVGIDDYDACTINSINPAGNAVTAVYADGLSKQDGIYPVWYMVNPTVFESGTGLVLTVVTDTKTITKTITLPEELNVMTGKFNFVKLNISGNNSSSVASLYQDFTSLSSLTSVLTASDGLTYVWSFDGCEISANAPFPAGLAIDSEASVTLPTIPGYKITGIRLYANPANADKGNTITLNGGTPVDFNNYVEGGLVATGGVLEIDVPENIQGSTLTLTSAGNTVLSGIAFELAEDSGSAEDFENDYYAQYIAGRDITINGETYNIANNGPAKLVKVTEITSNNINTEEEDVIFIDNAGVEGVTAVHAYRIVQPSVIVGRYKNSQPSIRFENESGAAQQLSIEADAVIKNLHITSAHTQSMLANSRSEVSVSLVVEDCMLTNTDGRAVVIDNNETVSFENVTVSNCVIEFASGSDNNSCVISYNTNKTDFSAKSMKVKNCVIYAPAIFPAGIVSLGYNDLQTTTADVEIEVTDNTLYNITSPNVVVRAWQAKSLVVNNNVAYNESTNVKSYLTAIYNTLSGTAEVKGNYLYTPFVADTNSWGLKFSGSYEVNSEDNFLHSQAQNCILTDQADLETGYIPVNTTVVTNGAGADYDTKYWIAQ